MIRQDIAYYLNDYEGRLYRQMYHSNQIMRTKERKYGRETLVIYSIQEIANKLQDWLNV